VESFDTCHSPDCASQTGSVVVSRPLRDPHGLAEGVADKAKPSESAQNTRLPPVPRKAGPSRLASGQRSLLGPLASLSLTETRLWQARVETGILRLVWQQIT